MTNQSTKQPLCDTSVSRNLNGIKVLAAEDNELNLEIVEHFLKNAGAEYVTAENGKGLSKFSRPQSRVNSTSFLWT